MRSFILLHSIFFTHAYQNRTCFRSPMYELHFVLQWKSGIRKHFTFNSTPMNTTKAVPVNFRCSFRCWCGTIQRNRKTNNHTFSLGFDSSLERHLLYLVIRLSRKNAQTQTHFDVMYTNETTTKHQPTPTSTTIITKKII